MGQELLTGLAILHLSRISKNTSDNSREAGFEQASFGTRKKMTENLGGKKVEECSSETIF